MVRAKDATLQVRISSTLMEKIDAAADKVSLSRSNWVNAALALAADEGAYRTWKVHAPEKGENRESRKRKPAK